MMEPRMAPAANIGRDLLDLADAPSSKMTG